MTCGTQSRWLSLSDVEPPIAGEQRRTSNSAVALTTVAKAGARLMLIVCIPLFLQHFSRCFAAEVVLLRAERPHPMEERAILQLAAFYGFQLNTVDLNSRDAVSRAMSLLRSPTTLAILASEDALSALDRKRVLAALRRRNGLAIPILVFGITGYKSASALKSWSGNAVHDCIILPGNFQARAVDVGRERAFTRSLTGLEFPAVASPTCKLQVEPQSAVQVLLSMRGTGEANPAVLVRLRSEMAEIFFVPEMRTFETKGGLSEAFSSLAPYILFLSYSVGDYGWHLDGHYANLTIDDARLIQPYGNLDYLTLLVEMEKHNFHTTVGFVPWNFDRNEPGVINLFRSHPDRFSVCVHGNNHDHQEFGSYTINSIQEEIADIKEGVARMERFRFTTGIPYDRFMVFPYGVAPEETFVALSRYNFLGTANVQNVPSDATFPSDPTFLLRSFTFAYGNFLSFSRYPAKWGVPRLETAIQLFMNNPVLFFDHQTFFEKGIGAFNEFADYVNQLQPDTRWTSLGEIARHSHLLRRRQDGEFDVWMLSNEMDLKNPTERNVVFNVARKENPSKGNRLRKIDDSNAAFAPSGSNVVTLRLVVPPHQTRKVRPDDQNRLDVSSEELSKDEIHVYLLRRISDFRDLYLSRSSWGRTIVHFYYDVGADSIELYIEQRWWGCATILLLFIWIRFRWYKVAKRPKARTTVGAE